MRDNENKSTPSKKTGGYTRRRFLKTGLVSTAGLALSACVGNDTAVDDPTPSTAASATDVPATNVSATAVAEVPATEVMAETSVPAETAVLEPTPACDDDDDPTIAQTEGPFYTPDTPERHRLREEGIVGTSLVVVGQVLTVDCQPIAGAVVDFWHADDGGNYDNEGYKLRGHQFTDENGRYYLETILPGLYPGRTRHIHVKVQGPETSLLTTQLYFPDEPSNSTDGIFDARLLMAAQESGTDEQAMAFDFVLT